MNQQERDKLRAEHYFYTLRAEHHFYTYDDRTWGMTVEACFICGDGYPCDIIKVLDAWQNSTENSTELTENCDHIRHNLCLCDFSDDGCSLDDEPDYNYCPKCGEKL